MIREPFQGIRYRTLAVQELIPLATQNLLWLLIESLPIPKDRLQVFVLSEANHQQHIIHTQERPNYVNEYLVPLAPVVTRIVYVQDTGESCCMCLGDDL